MSSNCNECGRKTPKKVYLCNPCINFDPDYSDYRTEEEIRYEEQYYKDMVEVEYDERELWRELDFSTFDEMEDSDEIDRMYWEILDEEGLTALHALTGKLTKVNQSTGEITWNSHLS